MLLAPSPASAGIILGPTVDLPWSQVDFQGGTVAMLANGSFAITSLRPDLNAYQVQFFNAMGDLVQTPLMTNPAPESVGVGSLGSSYLLVRQGYRGSNQGPDGFIADAHAYGQLFSDKGTPLGTQFPWPSSGVPNFAEFYRFGSAPRWRFLPITYEFLSDVGNGAYPAYSISLRVAEPNAIPALPPTEIGPPVVSYIEDAAINGKGRFVVDSFHCASYPPPITPPCVRGIQVFDDPMRPLTPFLTAVVDDTSSTVSVAINTHGQVLLNMFNAEGRLVVRLLNDNGTPASEELPVDTKREPYKAGLGEMKGLDDGSFVLPWIASAPMGPDGYGEALVVARFDAQTRQFDEPVVIGTTTYNFRNAILKMTSDGRGVVVWESQDLGDGPPDFGSFSGHLRLLKVRP
jgi:hypothetical protein